MTGRRRHRWWAFPVLAFSLVACGGTGTTPSKAELNLTAGQVPPDDEAMPADQGASSSAPGGSEPPGLGGLTPMAPDDPTKLVLAFAGDIHFEDYLAPLARDPDGLAALRALWPDADLRMANLETAITERGTRQVKAFTFRAPESALTTLKNAGLGALSMANNHGVDFGPQGLADTLAAISRSPVPVVGIGADERSAFAPRIVKADGVTIALLAASQVQEETLARFSASPSSGGIASAVPTTRLVAAVRAARAQADVVIVFLHWGIDYQECADARSKQTATELEAAGADVIVGAHSHRVGGAGWLGRSYVAYGLGNFVWWRSVEPDSRTGILRLTIDPTIARQPSAQRTKAIVQQADWQPLLIGRDGIPARPPDADATRLHTLWEQAGACSGVASAP